VIDLEIQRLVWQASLALERGVQLAPLTALNALRRCGGGNEVRPNQQRRDEPGNDGAGPAALSPLPTFFQPEAQSNGKPESN
jgi:hypothetical protein